MTTDHLTPEDMNRWQVAMARLDDAKRELDHAEEVARLVNEVIAARYALTPADKVTSDGTIHRAPKPKAEAPEPPAAPLPPLVPDPRKPLERFAVGDRVWVYAVDGDASFDGRLPGTVQRVTGNGDGWVALDYRSAANLHPFDADDPVRATWVRTAPHLCSAIVPGADALEALDVEPL